MVVKTKFDIGEEVFIKQAGVKGMVLRILVFSEDHQEYHVKFGPGEVDALLECEMLTEEEWNVYKVIKGSDYGEEG